MKCRFQDRFEAGRELADKLREFNHEEDTIVLGLPRGGIPVAVEVARILGLPLGVMIARKFGLSSYPERTLGAVSAHGSLTLNYNIADAYGISRTLLYDLASQSQIELNRWERAYHAISPEPDVHGLTVLLADDGVATGSTILAAAEAARMRGATRVVIATPVIAGDTFDHFHATGQEVVAVIAPSEFHSIAEWYEDFRRPSDEEALQLLAEAIGKKSLAV
jgi:putative phosphoribosyl transferase